MGEISHSEGEPQGLDLTAEEKQDLRGMLDRELRDTNLNKDYADRLNGIFKKFVGRNHDVWEVRFGDAGKVYDRQAKESEEAVEEFHKILEEEK